MSTYELQAQVTNATGRTINSYWIKHKPHASSSHDDWGYGTNLADGDKGDEFTIQLESNTTDVWVVTYADDDNNLYASSYEFNAGIDHKDGDVEIKIEGSEAEVLQGSDKQGSSAFNHAGDGRNT